MTMKYSAIVLLGGSSSRLNELGVNKVYLYVNKKPIFMHSVDIFKNDPDCSEIIVVYNKNDFDTVTQFVSDDIKLVEGGSARYESVLNGIKEANNFYVLVHDGARPNINLELINRVKKGLSISNSVTLGVPVTDTLKKVTPTGVETINRESVYYIQTPQGSKRDSLIKCLSQVKKEDNITDDVMAFEKYSNVNPLVVLGDKNNIKVTTIEDYELIKFLMEKKDV